MKLTAAERRAIFGGNYRAIRRPTKPAVKAGDSLVLSWTRGGRQIVDRTTGATIDVPRRPTVWIVFKDPEQREDGWIVPFEVRDDRRPRRLLASTPSPRRSGSGLKTRQRDPERVPKRGHLQEPWTPESERGYGAGGQVAVDHLEAVDDETLRGFAARSRHSRAQARRQLEEENTELAEEARRRRERAIRDRLREKLKTLPPAEKVKLLAGIERQIQEAGEAA